MYVIVETDIHGEMPESKNDRCYLNHAYLSKMHFGSLDMAWHTDSALEAEGMASRMHLDQKLYRHHAIIEI